VRPDFVFFDFSSIKDQINNWHHEKHSSEAKSSDDELGRLLVARVWFFSNQLPQSPWSFIQIRISPSLMTKGGFRTIITSKRFRAYLVGGTNSRQNWEFQIERKTLRARASMNLKRAYFAYCVKEDRAFYVIGGRGDLNATSYYNFVKS
jgi:hypothetical protein